MEDKQEIKITKKHVEAVEKLTKKLFSLMKVNVKYDVSKESVQNFVLVNISSSEETGLLIGSRGETINSIQAVLGMMVRQETGDWIRVVVNIADWREKQEERLKELADQAVERVIQTGSEEPLYNLSATERRTIHMYLSENKNVETESSGEGRGRYLIVRPKK